MARQPDKAGTYRIRQINGEWKLAGLTNAGRRVRLAFNSEREALDAAATLFNAPKYVPSHVPMDDWGLPMSVPGVPSIDQGVADAMGVAMGVDPPLPETTPFPEPAPIVDTEAEKKREASMARAKSLCEFFGIAYAGGVAFGSKKLCAFIDLEPVNPSPKNVTELGKAACTAFQDLVGDWEVGPWTMLLLLSIAMPTSMILQSPKRKALPGKTPDSSPLPTSDSSSGLKAVP
jgi:hypothetical protein